MRSNISKGLVAHHLALSPLCCIQFPPIKDFLFGGDSGGRQGHRAQVCQFFANAILPLSHKAALFTADPVLICKEFIASIAAFRKAPWAQTIANGEVVLEFFFLSAVLSKTFFKVRFL